ncbi:hypothetical protein A7K91_05775 [Paenibacillus oryzae]|uniref:DUF4309 domain-containing protein n=1 Tax=Paenibacillus oryzae TaxID=1844972 RepID=A0A1A5YHC7_9BACL|nr:hypothetical protein [Paenibacillus oryzae]OBR65066.1 hypothetical protein A7K91_05775 [Paenibacillus oryzae]
MKIKKTYYHHVMQWAALSALLLLLASCQSAPQNTTVKPESIPEASEAAKGPQQAYLESSQEEEAEEEQTEWSNQAEDIEGHSSAETSSLNKNKRDESNLWEDGNPQLGGVLIGSTKKQLEKQFGQALDSYKLEDGKEQITIYEYSGFSVGFGPDGTVSLVEIYDSEVDSGLNGLVVGDPRETAIKLLGQPGSQSGYLLTYSDDDASLRLDVDPSTNEIVSIKLIASS